MLTALQIKNFAIIEAQQINFGPGLNVISGETGAGKSIVLEAFKLILGGRGGGDQIRNGAESLEVSAVFDLSVLTSEQKSQLPDQVQECNELLITREINQAGRNKIFLNGRVGTVGLIKEVAERLINICGQNQSLRLFDSSYHRELIDSYGELGNILREYRQKFEHWSLLVTRLSNSEARSREFILRRQGLEALVEEISALGLYPGIREDLENEVKRLSFAEQLISGVGELSSSYEEEDGLSAQLRRRALSLQSLVKLDPSLEKLRQTFESGRSLLEEAFSELSAYSSGLTLDEEKLKAAESRLADLLRIEKKYRTNDEGLIKLLDDANKELMQFLDGENLDRLRQEVSTALKELQGIGVELRKERTSAGKKLTKEVERELVELSMKDSRLKISMQEAVPGPHGMDEVELLISTNKGEEFKPIKLVASGGELSRIMLVLKKVLRDKSGVHVLVFDEVDSGISGGVARAVGEKLRALAQEGQVICVTHLAQVASLADRHLLVEKSSGKRTVSVVRELTKEDRVEEVARMLAGFEVTEASRASARELFVG
jgi:DNA repair protein RecN (Recombination protein N)